MRVVRKLLLASHRHPHRMDAWRWASSSKISDYGFNYERIVDTSSDANWLHVTGRYCTERFIPVTRRVLLHKILADELLMRKEHVAKFQELATGLDSALTSCFRERLQTIKSLYNPLSPDRDTIPMKSFTRKELLQRELLFLSYLTDLLDQANFYKLPHDVMWRALAEDNFGEGVVVSVKPRDYATLHFWVIGMDVGPVDNRPWYVQASEKIKSAGGAGLTMDPLQPQSVHRFGSWSYPILAYVYKKLFGRHIPRVERYKRVVLAMRKKDDMKLHVKAFKDIPCENLEFLLPGGKIKMKLIDKIRFLVMSGSFLLAALFTTAVELQEYKFEAGVIFAAVVLVLASRSWSWYNHKKNAYVTNLSRTLYFKSVANNHALLSLITDRTEDELYKAALLIYAMVHKYHVVGGVTTSCSIRTLKSDVERWLLDTFDVKIAFNASHAIAFLTERGLFRPDPKAECHFFALPMDTAVKLLPMLKRNPVLHHADLLNILSERRILSKDALKSNLLPANEASFKWK